MALANRRAYSNQSKATARRTQAMFNQLTTVGVE
jgi:hypothetical protein